MTDTPPYGKARPPCDNCQGSCTIEITITDNSGVTKIEDTCPTCMGTGMK